MKRGRIFIVASFVPFGIVYSNTGTRGRFGRGWPACWDSWGPLAKGVLFARLIDGFDDDIAQDGVACADGFGEVGDYAFGVEADYGFFVAAEDGEDEGGLGADDEAFGA